MFSENGILLNPRKSQAGQTFVTRKISRAMAKSPQVRGANSTSGNLDAVRDWGYAPSMSPACGRCCSARNPVTTPRPLARLTA